MPAADIKLSPGDLARSRGLEMVPRPEPEIGGHLARLREYADYSWEPWTRDDPAEPLFPSDESMCAAAEASRTAYSIMHLTKDQLVDIHSKEHFDGFEETVANLMNTAAMLKAVVQMIEGAHERMLASACALLRNQNGGT
jgi:hypothetical protein